MTAALRVDNLVKSYGPIQAVRGVGFEVLPGEIFGLLGPNGAGKTTLIECILGLRQPDSGSIRIIGIDALAEPERVKLLVGAQLQATALQDPITPRQALNFFASFYRNAILSDVLLDRFGLTGKADARFDTLSTGQRQRLQLALAFVNNPQLLFLDEPTAGLDPGSRRDLHADIRRLKTEGRTVILCTHYIEEAHELCDRIAIVDAGRIVAEGRPDELIAAAKLPQVVVVKTSAPLEESRLAALEEVTAVEPIERGWRLTTDDITRCIVNVVQLVESQNLQLIDLRIRRPSLEDVFLMRTGHTMEGGAEHMSDVSIASDAGLPPIPSAAL